MATPLSTLLTEFFARGYDDLNDGGAGATRAARWLNQAHLYINARADWPWLLTDTTGTAPLTISDVRAVLSVTDTTNDNDLRHIDRRELTTRYPDLPDTGTAEYWYWHSNTVIRVYPANTSATFAVRYIKRPAVLTSSDNMLIPDEWMDLVIDYAVVKAEKDAKTRSELRQTFEQDLAVMVESELNRSLDGPDVPTLVGGSIDW